MSGLLNKMICQTTLEQVGAIPSSSDYAAVNVHFLNTHSADVEVSLYVVSGAGAAVPALVDGVWEGLVVPGNGGTAEKMGMLCSAGERIFVKASQAGVVVARVEFVSESA